VWRRSNSAVTQLRQTTQQKPLVPRSWPRGEEMSGQDEQLQTDDVLLQDGTNAVGSRQAVRQTAAHVKVARKLKRRTDRTGRHSRPGAKRAG